MMYVKIYNNNDVCQNLYKHTLISKFIITMMYVKIYININICQKFYKHMSFTPIAFIYTSMYVKKFYKHMAFTPIAFIYTSMYVKNFIYNNICQKFYK